MNDPSPTTGPAAPAPAPYPPPKPLRYAPGRHTQVFLASTLYGTATLAAALDAGLFPAADRRLLLITNNAANPEATPAADEMAGFAQLRSRFDDVRDWNDVIRPLHPGAWEPRAEDVPLWERHLRMLWGLGDDRLTLVVESIQVAPARALVQLFPDAALHVYADGLMSYGPTRNKLSSLIGSRVERLLHPDLLPGVRPMLLTEFDVPAEIVPAEELKKVLAELGAAAEPTGPDGADGPDGPDALDEGSSPALLLGQYLSALNILTADEEERLHVEMLRGAAGLGHRDVVFKPHPMAPARVSRLLEDEADGLGVRLTVLDTPVLAEVLYERLRPALVAGAFSTALMTASTLYGLPVATIGTGTLLERLTPYENSNRIPVTIADALLPPLADPAAVRAWRAPTAEETRAKLGGLLTAVGFTMQPRIHARLRPDVERWLAAELDADTWRYFKRRRLTVEGLPGGLPKRLAFVPRSPAVRRVARRARALRRRLR
ncbi:polysialyltransferase family glycosyltransferase [Streptomyces sp. MAR4 CNX-425]|uniref:polysialyltransferase family glycosyltransferase n=1 Tax=Streptomyces sp. MAR4 CNX-425 TaxID=3406343 RepID=UPI003B50E2F7